MCTTNDSSIGAMGRRHFLGFAGAVAVGGMLPGVALAKGEKPKTPASSSPDESLQRLKTGNQNFVRGNLKNLDNLTNRKALASGQHPFAIILSCSDSRVPPEIVFDAGLGELFVCRVAGNVINPDTIGSIEFAVAELKVPHLLVLGHQSCGAVGAAIAGVTENKRFPGNIEDLVRAIRPAVEAVPKRDDKAAFTEAVVKENVKLVVDKLRANRPILNAAVREGRLRVDGAVYQLDTGEVEFLG